MEKIIIGIAELKYNIHGFVVMSSFKPSLNIEHTEKLAEILNKIECTDVSKIKQQADIVFASWFSRITDIEIADRSKYVISSNIITCKKFKNGKTKNCAIEYSFKEVI